MSMSTRDSFSSSSPIRVASSPTRSDAALVTTPPSSPPAIFQKLSSPQAGIKKHAQNDAFSVLGKRKLPLHNGDNNARPKKRKASEEMLKRKDSSLTQMHLSLGQKIEKRCKECGMVYVVCSAEDRALHEQYHSQLTGGCDVGSQLASKSTQHGLKHDDKICRVTRDDPPWKKKHARNVLNIITSCLGACEISDQELWRSPSETDASFEMWMYIRGSVCIAALLTETWVRKARRVIKPKQEDSNKAKASSALERLRQRHEASIEQNDAPLTISDDTCTAIIGICRVWTAPTFQKQGLAVTLLNTMYQRWCSDDNDTLGQQKIDHVAFSQPTAAGTKLARKWFGKQSGWLVYS